MSEQTQGAAQPDSAVTLVGRVLPEQRVKYTVTPQANALMSCEGLGGQIAAIGKLIKTVAKEDGQKAHALIGGISMDGRTGAITFEIVVVTEVKQ